MALTLRFSALATALVWMPAALAQVNPPLTDSAPARMAAPTPASAPTRAALRQAPAALPVGVAESIPVIAGAPMPASPSGALGHSQQAERGPSASTGSAPAAAAFTAEGLPANTGAQALAAKGAVSVTSSTATQAAPAPRAPRLADGEATRGLMALQANASAAGPERPVLGPAATAAWDRYLESFTHPIPERFEQTVERSQQ